jgi:YesN/AraC family two-component response regulator
LEASNGLEGLTVAREVLPDLIISDIIMPEMDGSEMVTRLKNDVATSHIPVIMLTAKSTEEDMVEGIRTGADSYITKPFNIDVLKARIDNLLRSRQKLREKYSNELMLKPRNIIIGNRDGELLSKLIGIIEENMSDPDFSVKTLADGVGLSRMQLYRKLKALVDKTPHDLINTIRLERAAQILVQKQMTVSEVAYMVGFNTPKYFSRCFREKYGMLPTQYVKAKWDGEENTEPEK